MVHRCVDTYFCSEEAMYEGVMAEYKCKERKLSSDISGVIADYCRLMCNARGESCPAYYLQKGNICHLVKARVYPKEIHGSGKADSDYVCNISFSLKKKFRSDSGFCINTSLLKGDGNNSQQLAEDQNEL